MIQVHNISDYRRPREHARSCFWRTPFHLTSLLVYMTSLAAPAAESTATLPSSDQAQDQASLFGTLRKRSSRYLLCNGKGEIVAVTLPKEQANDRNLFLLSSVQTMRELRLVGDAHHTAITKTGIQALQHATNLRTLSVSCIVDLPKGVLTSICGLPGLERLALVNCDAPEGEYASLTNLVNLESLNLSDARNFHDSNLLGLSELKHLSSIELVRTGVSEKAENVLQTFTGLTNAVVR
jgi:hypothetical protein